MSALIRYLGASLLGATLLLSGCAAPETAPSAGVAPGGAAAPIAAAPVLTAPGTPADASAPRGAAPPMSDPLPPERVADRAPARVPATPAATLAPDRSCRTDADCTVKDIGNCCGYFPACVNVAAKTDPKAVQAQCASSGMASVCGFEEISSCSCVQGRCAAGGGAIR